MDKTEVLKYVQSGLEDVSEMMRRTLFTDIDLLSTVDNTLLAQSGKKIRPILALLVAGCCDQVNEDTIRVAAVAELLHNATLLHDDVVDDGVTRRGVPTVNQLMGGRASVLLGDYWLVKAVNLILSCRNHDRLIALFSETLSDLASGEIFQMQKALSCDTTEEDYFRIVYGKTASLFESTGRAAAITVGATPEQEKASAWFSRCLGEVFQIQDDILDYEGGEALGKPTLQDIREQKITMPLLGALGNVSTGEQTRIRGMIRDIPSHPEYAERIASFVEENGGIQKAKCRMDQIIEEGLSTLASLPQGYDRDCLGAIFSFAARRNY